MTCSFSPIAQGAFYATLPLVLASASPRRREALRLLGLEFEIIPPTEDAEPLPLTGENPADYAYRAATAKALTVANRLRQSTFETPTSTFNGANELHLRLRNGALTAQAPGPLVLGADTVVALEGEILGKPQDKRHALDMLLRLAGKSHEVFSACCCCLPDGTIRHAAGSACVHFFPWPRNVLAAYADTDEVLDKAGAYSIQGSGAFLAQRIEGQVSAVVGLPLTQLVSLFLELEAIRARAAP